MIPQRHVRADIVLDRLESLSSIVNHLTWDITKSGCNLVWIEGMVIHPTHKTACLLIGEIQGCCQQNEIFNSIIRTQGGIHCRKDSTDAPAQQTKFFTL